MPGVIIKVFRIDIYTMLPKIIIVKTLNRSILGGLLVHCFSTLFLLTKLFVSY